MQSNLAHAGRVVPAVSFALVHDQCFRDEEVVRNWHVLLIILRLVPDERCQLFIITRHTALGTLLVIMLLFVWLFTVLLLCSIAKVVVLIALVRYLVALLAPQMVQKVLILCLKLVHNDLALVGLLLRRLLGYPHHVCYFFAYAFGLQSVERFGGCRGPALLVPRIKLR